MSVACSTYGGEERCIRGFGSGNLSERDHLQDLSVNGNIILKWIFNKWDGSHGLIWLRIRTGACECGNEPSASIHAGNFLTNRELVSFARRTLLHGVSWFDWPRGSKAIDSYTRYSGTRPRWR